MRRPLMLASFAVALSVVPLMKPVRRRRAVPTSSSSSSTTWAAPTSAATAARSPRRTSTRWPPTACASRSSTTRPAAVPTRASAADRPLPASGRHGPSRQRRSAQVPRAPRAGSATTASRSPKCCGTPATSRHDRQVAPRPAARHAAVETRLRSGAQLARRRHLLPEPAFPGARTDRRAQSRSSTASRTRRTDPCSARTGTRTDLLTDWGLEVHRRGASRQTSRSSSTLPTAPRISR